VDLVIEAAPCSFEHRLLNRELSWLDFNDRVLSLAAEPGIPLLERAKFCAICSANLDEFFQVRVAALRDQIAAGIEDADARRPPRAAAGGDRRAVERLVDRQDRCSSTSCCRPSQRGGQDRAMGRARRAERRRWRVLRRADLPGAHAARRRPGSPVPVHLRPGAQHRGPRADPETGERRFVRLKVPTVFPRLIPGDGRFLPAEQLIAAHLHTLFVGMVVEEWSTFRVTRNADLTLEEEEADDLLEAVEMELRRRRFKRRSASRCTSPISAEMLELLVRELDLDPTQRVATTGRCSTSAACSAARPRPPDLKDRPGHPSPPAASPRPRRPTVRSSR
jgi:polyphosphate kinase